MLRSEIAITNSGSHLTYKAANRQRTCLQETHAGSQVCGRDPQSRSGPALSHASNELACPTEQASLFRTSERLISSTLIHGI